MQKFTEDDLLLYIYGDTAKETATAIEAALETDWSLQEKYKDLSASVKNLDIINFSPRSSSIDKILQYAGKPVSELTTEA